MIAIIQPSSIFGEINIPPSKSMMQRACALALLHHGETIIVNPGVCDDDKTAISIIQNLGAKVDTISSNQIHIISDGQLHPPKMLHCGESGLSLRMFAFICAISGEAITLTGEGSLLKRSMIPMLSIFDKLNISYTSNAGFLPITIMGKLQPQNIHIDAGNSSQYLTGLLFAFAKLASQPIQIQVQGLVSKPYIDLSIQALKHFGYDVTHHHYQTFNILPTKPNNQNVEIAIEGDWSSASFFLVAAALKGNLKIKGLQLDSVQADKKIMDVLSLANVVVLAQSSELVVEKSLQIKSFEFDATECPDLFPSIVLLAMHGNGSSKIKGVHRLQNKESNRAATIMEAFNKLGGKVAIVEDLMIVEGNCELIGCVVSAHHDHRIAMALSIAGLLAKGETTIEQADSVNKSYPQFFEHLKSLNASVTLLK